MKKYIGNTNIKEYVGHMKDCVENMKEYKLGKIPSCLPIQALALYITSETGGNSMLPSNVGSETWKNSERSLETRLEKHEIPSLFFGLTKKLSKSVSPPPSNFFG